MPTEPVASLPPTLIYGAGAVGCLLGGVLAAGGALVTLLGRPAVAEAVACQGLTVVQSSGTRRIHLPVVTSIDALPARPSLVLLTVKAYAVAAALPDMPRLASGTLTASVVWDSPATVRQETAGGVTLAPVRGDVPLDQFAAALTAAGLPAGVVPRYQDLKWSKLLLNIMANATAALLALPPAAIYADPRLFAVERAAFIEAFAVMLGAGIRPIPLPGFNVPLLAHAMRLPAPLARRLIAARAARGRGEKRPSLWLDVDRGMGTTEVRWLNGAVADLGARLGVPTPVNAALTALLEEVARNPERRRAFAGRPDALLAALGQTSGIAQA